MGSGLSKRAGEVLTSLDRIARAEKSVEALANNLKDTVEGCNKSFQLVENRLRSIEEMVLALVDVCGSDAVKASMDRIHANQTQEQLQRAEEAISEAVKAGNLTAMAVLPNKETLEADVDKSLASKILIVGRQFNKEGQLQEPGRVQLPLVRVVDEVRFALADKKPGDVIEIADGTFALDAAYIETQTETV